MDPVNKCFLVWYTFLQQNVFIGQSSCPSINGTQGNSCEYVVCLGEDFLQNEAVLLGSMEESSDIIMYDSWVLHSHLHQISFSKNIFQAVVTGLSGPHFTCLQLSLISASAVVEWAQITSHRQQLSLNSACLSALGSSQDWGRVLD